MSRYIDADALFDLIDDCVCAMYEDAREVKDEVLRIIADERGADVEPIRNGHWIVHERAEAVFGLIIPNFECSECHTWVRPDGRGKRCLECGAKMDGKET